MIIRQNLFGGLIEMAICSKCGAQLNETSKFCPECGTPVLEASAHTEEHSVNIYAGTENASDEAMSAFQDIDRSAVSPDGAAEISEAAAEKVLEDMPEIIKINSVTGAPDKAVQEAASESVEESAAPRKKNENNVEKAYEANAEKTEERSEPKSEKNKPGKDDFSDFGAFDKSEFDPDLAQTVGKNASKEEKIVSAADNGKKKHGAVIAVAAVAVLAAAAVTGVFVVGGRNDGNIPAVVTRTTVTEPESETIGFSQDITDMFTESQTAVSSETQPSVTETNVSESERLVSETDETEAAVILKTADEIAAGVVIEPEHSYAAENLPSAELSLSANGFTNENLSDSVLFIAEFNADAPAEGAMPVSVVLTVSSGNASADVAASSSGDGVSVFEYSKIISEAENAGIQAGDIDMISFKGSGAGVDVYSVTVMNG